MKTKLAALASTLALTLLMSTVWSKGPDLGDFLPSAAGVQPVPADGLGEVTLGMCENGSTPFTGQFTDLVKGTTSEQTYKYPDPVTGPFDVTVAITVNSDNSFSFEVTDESGSIHKIKVKAGLGTTVYDYANYVLNPDFVEGDPESERFLDQISSDSDLNVRANRSQAVSHLDFCLSNKVRKSFTEFYVDCFEGDDGITEGDFDNEGCNTTGGQNTLLPQAIENDPEHVNATVTQVRVPKKTPAWDPLGLCTGDYIAFDPRLDPGDLTGKKVVDPRVLDLEDLFDTTGLANLDEDFTGVSLPIEVVGAPCIGLVHGHNTLEFNGITGVDWSTTETGPTLTVTQIPEGYPGMYDDVDRITAPLCEVGESPAATVPPAPPGMTCTLDLQFAEEATVQPDNKDLPNFFEKVISVFTNEVFNGSRTKSSRGTFYGLNLREWCVDLTLVPGDAGYEEAVRQCKMDLALVYFDNLRLALDVSENALPPGVNINHLYTPWNKARSQFDNGHFRKAINDLNQLRDRVLGIQWTVFEHNDPGGLIVRIDGLLHRAEQLQIFEARHGL